MYGFDGSRTIAAEDVAVELVPLNERRLVGGQDEPVEQVELHPLVASHHALDVGLAPSDDELHGPTPPPSALDGGHFSCCRFVAGSCHGQRRVLIPAFSCYGGSLSV